MAVVSLKKNGRFGIGQQSEAGTSVGPSDYYRLLSGNVDLQPNIVDIEETGGRDNTDHEQIGYDASFEIELAYDASVSHHKLVGWFLGGLTETGAGPTYNHEARAIAAIDDEASHLVSVSFDRGVVLDGTDQTIRLVDVFFDELELRIPSREYARIKLTGRATAYEEAAALVPVYGPRSRYRWGGYSLLMADYPDSPTTLAKAREATVTLRNGTDLDAFVAGDEQPDTPVAGALEAMIQVEKQLEASDPLYLAFKNRTRKNVSFRLSAVLGGNTFTTTIALSNAIQRTLEWPEISGASERGYLKGDWKGVDDGTTDAVVATMVDTEENY